MAHAAALRALGALDLALEGPPAAAADGRAGLRVHEVQLIQACV
eukprot:CAMPEP_0202337818 /NCGR_PEP_ID=MMETSP1126-20121109/351_1 /ASSEMBLY_ACC=CAM_ASM_000457 /TAXON_ID=3047 /ORGANISM="Dunaliella tertiolecta, Strain CCMP1320" /LENGTH=43 /DNA_ID= /DNA_START= /DNA_END= /DNA_ORIENTATION=